MSYYPTIEEDLQRAKDILARGKVIPPTPNLPIPIPERDFGGTIYAMDDFAAYKLLESFVAEIEALRPWKEAIIDACVVDWILVKEHESDPRKAVNDLLAWQQKLCLDPAISKPAADLHAEIKQLRRLVTTYFGQHCSNADAEGMSVLCECAICVEAKPMCSRIGSHDRE